MCTSVWNAIVGENLPCVAEPSNTTDQNAVAVTKTVVLLVMCQENFLLSLPYFKERWCNTL